MPIKNNPHNEPTSTLESVFFGGFKEREKIAYPEKEPKISNPKPVMNRIILKTDIIVFYNC